MRAPADTHAPLTRSFMNAGLQTQTCMQALPDGKTILCLCIATHVPPSDRFLSNLMLCCLWSTCVMQFFFSSLLLLTSCTSQRDQGPMLQTHSPRLRLATLSVKCCFSPLVLPSASVRRERERETGWLGTVTPIPADPDVGRADDLDVTRTQCLVERKQLVISFCLILVPVSCSHVLL